MSLFIDLKYINMVSNRLDKFKRTNDHLFNFRCPICGDSATKKNKARGYLYKLDNNMVYKCHNCDAGMSLGRFLEQVDSLLHREYSLETFKERGDSKDWEPKGANWTPNGHKLFDEKPETAFDFTPDFNRPIRLIDSLMDRLDKLPNDHEAVIYAKSRMIPETQFHRLYHVEDIRNLVQLNAKYKETLTIEQPRLAMPFITPDGKLTGMALRGMRGEKLRYINLVITEEMQIFGLDEIDLDKEVYVVEGPIDSLFIDNAIACIGTAFGKVDKLNLKNFTMIFDNQPRNREVCKLIENQIDLGNKVCIWPEDLYEKDINEMIMKGIDRNKIRNIISSNTCQGLEARLQFMKWRKC